MPKDPGSYLAGHRRWLSTLSPLKGRITDWQLVKKRIEESLKEYLLKETGRSPLIVPVVLEV